MFLDIHALHTLPYSNANRDGLGSPKTCVYGGTPRIRVSSQSWKRPARLDVEALIGEPTVRTRQIAVHVRDELVEQGWPVDDARRAGRALLHAAGLEPDDEGDVGNVLLWLPRSVLADLTALAAAHRDLVTTVPLPELGPNGKAKKLPKAENDKRAAAIKETVAVLTDPVTEILNRRSPTIALLGRMLADNPGHTVDGATQVAHAFTVHEAAPDFDYFTAVDDLARGSGAGHLATAEFATGTFYRYCSINVAQLVRELGDVDTAMRVVHGWAATFLRVVPSGKRNSTAHNTPPDLAYLAVRTAPLSMAAAFEKSVPTSDEGYVDAARARLDHYAGRVHTFLGDPGAWSGYADLADSPLTHLGHHYEVLDELVDAACASAREHLPSQAAV